MRRRIILGITLVFLSLFGGLFNLKAENSSFVQNIEGVSIRKKTENSYQGLRFYAKLEKGVNSDEHGFYLVYGETTINDLENKIINSNEEPIIINDREVFKVIVSGVNQNDEFSVVLTGIPEEGYFDEISVIAYAVVDGKIRLSSNPNRRSVADVVLKMANALEEIDDVVAVNAIIQTNKKKVYANPQGDIIISQGVFELDHQALKDEFLNDWNIKFNFSLNDLVADEFFLLAKAGSTDEDSLNNNLFSTNLYKFFNDNKLNNKWSWLLDYIIDQCEIFFPSNQAKAIKGDGTLGDNVLWNGAHLSYSISNFFNQSFETGKYFAIDFTESTRYESIKDFNDKIFVNLTNYKLYNKGDEFRLPAPVSKAGYRFNHYKKGSELFNPGDSFIVNDETTLEANYDCIQYSLRFYDGDNSISELNSTYNVEDTYSLPTFEKDGYEFLGWYNNTNLEGQTVNRLRKGNTGELNFYGKWKKVDSTPETYSITYNLNGGTQPAGSIPTTYTNESNEIILPVPTRSGYNFLGWYTANTGGIKATSIPQGSTGNKTFYARWEPLGPTDADKVLEAKNALKINYSSGDTASSVTKNLTLPTSGLNNTTITWTTSDSTTVTNTGVVNRKTTNLNVTLTATIKLNSVTETKTFTVIVIKVEQVDPSIEYTLTFNLNGGAWPTTGGGEAYANRDAMILDFLTDFYNFVKPSGVSLNDFIHGVGKTSGFDGLYNTTDTFEMLYDANVKGVNASTGKFINQPQYNKWVPLFDVMEEYTNIGVTAEGDIQSFWGSPYTGERRIKPFIQKQNLWSSDNDSLVQTLTNKIPNELKGGSTGTPITVPTKYKTTDNDIILPAPIKSGDSFIGWYDNSNYTGSIITKITKGSTGNKTFYARYSSTEVPEVPLTETEKMVLAKAALSVGYASGDTVSSVTKNLTLAKTGLHGSTITWASNNTSTINSSGAVVRKDNDVTVILTATIKLGSLTETKTFTVTVKKIIPEPTVFTIAYELNGGSFGGFKNKTELATAFLTDLYSFVGPSENLTTFMHGAGKTSGFDGTWYSNEEHRAKIYDVNIKSGNNNYFLSHSTYQAKWKLFADFMDTFVQVGNPEQDFWSSPYTGNLRMKQYFTNVKPGGAWSDEDMAKLPTGLSANVPYEYNENSPAITLPKVTRSGYTFEGWYTNATFTSAKVTSIPKGSTGNKTFYAKWSQPLYTITLNLNGGTMSKYTKTNLINAFLNDLYSFISPSENLTVFKHGSGKTSGFDGTWYSNEEHRGKIYAANVKSGNNNYFLSSSLYQAKWKPFADFMTSFVKVGNPDQEFWSSPYTGNLRMKQYFTNVKPGGAWTDAEMSKTPGTITPKTYSAGSEAIILPTATKASYKFDGWYTANTGGSKVASIPKNSTGNKTYYARWSTSIITSFEPRFFKTKADFENSPAYKKYTEYASRVVYDKSFPIPGLERTNIKGKVSNQFVPQGLTYAKDYFLLASYDKEEKYNSVIYVVDKNGNFKTIIILPRADHVGGLAFDGANVWVSGYGSTVYSFKYSHITTAVNSGKEYYVLSSYQKSFTVATTASFLGYYNNMLWVGRWDLDNVEYMYGYTIGNKTGTPTLTRKHHIQVPSRTQGVAFTSTGGIILSISAGRNPTYEKHIAQLRFYKPSWSSPGSDGLIYKNNAVKVLSIPPMSEGAVTVGSYFYVNFESAATYYLSGPYWTDRVIAFRVADFF